MLSGKSNVQRQFVEQQHRRASRLFRADPLIDLVAMDRNLGGTFKTQSRTIAAHVENSHDDVISDMHSLTNFSTEYEHGKFLLELGSSRSTDCGFVWGFGAR